MNFVQLSKVNPGYAKSLSSNPSQITLENSRIIKSKVRENRLFCLKKLFANNLEIQTISENKKTKALHEEIKAFEKSKLVRHSDKNLSKYFLGEVPKNYYLPSNVQKDNLGYNNPVNQTEFLPFDHLKNHQKNDLNKSFDPCLQEKKVKNLNITKLSKQRVQNSHQKIKFSQEKASYSLHESPTYSKRKNENKSIIGHQDNHRVKKEMKQLRKIGRMLIDIKSQILKNRSLIIEGLDQIKDIDKRKIKNRSTDFSFSPEDLNRSQWTAQQDEKRNDLTENRIRVPRNSDKGKPKVEYIKCYKIR